MASESSELSKTDPGCVTEVGRSANSVVWRNPDGTLTSRKYTNPVNYQAADGVWQPIDTRLGPNAAGVVTNRGGPFSVKFGGDASASSLVSVAAPHGTVSFQFEGAATSTSTVSPPAQATGSVGGAGSDTMTYSNVIPGVDLRYQVLGQALKEAIVLNGQLSPGQLPSFRFALTTSGLQATTAANGAIQFVDAKGTVVFTVPSGTAIDAAGATTSVSLSLVGSSDPNVSELTVSLDVGWLSDAARVFPVTIDPSLSQPEAFAVDTYIANGSNANTNFFFYSQFDYSLGEFVDNAGVLAGVTYRSLQNFDLSGVSGAYIVSADWHGYAYAVSGTTPVALTLHPINATWDPSTVTWNTQPAERLASATSGGYSGADWQSANITSWVRNYASGAWTNFGLALLGPTNGRAQLAADLTDTPNYSYVDVTYDAYPTLSNFSAGGQYNQESVHWTQPTLSATITDGDTATNLTGKFELWNAAHTTKLYSGTGSSVGSAAATQWLVPASLPAGTTYSWRVDGYDGTATSAWSAWQTLTVDQTAPNTPTGSIAGVTLNAWNTSGGSSASATFGDSSADMYGFEWGLDVANNPTTPVLWNAGISGAQVTINPTWGWHDLAVRAIDLAGNVSTSVQHFTFGWGLGGFSTPQTGATTQARVTAQVNTTTSYTGMSLQWRRADIDTWADIPAGDVTYQSTGTGIGSWPVTATPGTSSTAFPALVWNAANTVSDVDGTLQLRAGFDQSGTYTYLTDAASIPHLALNQSAFGGGFASAPVGPGSANLLTGNLALSATDVAVPAGTIARTFQSRNPSATGSAFGPGWTSNIGSGRAMFQSVVDNTNTVVITAAGGSESAFSLLTNGSYPYTYKSPNGSTDALTKVSSTRFTLSILGSLTYGFTLTSGAQFMATDATDATGSTYTTTWTVAGGITEPTQMTAPPPTGVDCATAPLTTRGCHTVTFAYASTTQSTALCGASLGDYAGQIRNVYYTAWNPAKSGGAGMSTMNVATYCYDSTGMLRAEWDPRISPALKTQYTYNTDGQVDTVTPPGTNAWHFTYAPIGSEPAGTGRVATVYRAELSPLGNATTTFVYQIPLTTAGGGAYNMDATTVGAWGQQDLPTDATAVFPPDQTPSGSPPSSYTRATVYYMDANTLPVNVAQPGGYITTAEYDNAGHVIRTLTAANRQEALAYSTTPGVQASQSRLLDTENTYDPTTGVNLVDSYGPAHMVALPDGTNRLARRHTNFGFQAAPECPTVDLVTSQSESAAPVDGTADQDARATNFAYCIGTDTSGLTLGTPLQTTVDPGSSPHLNLTTTTKYDATTGQMTARILPAHPTGGDAHETDFVYYTAGPNTPATCGGYPELATLFCHAQPAAQPGTSGLPNLATSQVTAYNMYGQPETTVDTNGTENRTAAVTYDAASRQTSQHVTGTSGAGTARPTVTTAYDTTTGQPYTTTDGTLTTSRTYDALGRLHTYQDADGNTSTYAYDLLDRLSTLNDGKGTATLTYNDVGAEARGLPTTINYGTGIGSFTATYDADGNLATQTSPGSFAATFTRDETGEITNLAYTKGTAWWPASTAQYDIHGERTSASAALEIYTYGYDTTGRLTRAMDVGLLFSCPDQRVYQFDADTNRTQLQDTVGCTGSQTTTTKISAYDGADASRRAATPTTNLVAQPLSQCPTQPPATPKR